MGKLIFLDIDGTLCGSDGTVPVKAQEAVRTAREKGHQVFLCSGRSRGEIPDCIMQVGFDGLVGGAGACVEYRGEILFHRTLTKEAVGKVADYLEKYRIVYVLETNGDMYIPEYAVEGVKERFLREVKWKPEIIQDFFGRIQIVSDYRTVENVNKITYFDACRPKSEVLELFGDEFTIVTNSLKNIGNNSAEISEKGINKAEGIKIIMKKLHASEEDVIAVGDSTNDIEMLKMAGCGVAMGNALPELKEAADMVTDDVDEDGMYRCFVKLNLI